MTYVVVIVVPLVMVFLVGAAAYVASRIWTLHQWQIQHEREQLPTDHPLYSSTGLQRSTYDYLRIPSGEDGWV